MSVWPVCVIYGVEGKAARVDVACGVELGPAHVAGGGTTGCNESAALRWTRALSQSRMDSHASGLPFESRSLRRPASEPSPPLSPLPSSLPSYVCLESRKNFHFGIVSVADLAAIAVSRCVCVVAGARRATRTAAAARRGERGRAQDN